MGERRVRYNIDIPTGLSVLRAVELWGRPSIVSRQEQCNVPRQNYLGAVEPVELQHNEREGLSDWLDHSSKADQSDPNAPAQLRKKTGVDTNMSKHPNKRRTFRNC